MIAIRGAICAEDTEESIKLQSVKLMDEIFHRNALLPKDIISIIFTCTDDLTAAYPAKFVRELFDLKDVAFMCCQEQKVDGQLKKCIRVCVLSSKQDDQSVARHCYLGDAAQLRTDCADGR